MKAKSAGNISMLIAAVLWGLMSPIGKQVMLNGIPALSLATFRMIGAAACFWLTSVFVKTEEVAPHDFIRLFFAGLFGVILNQGAYIFGLYLTSPIDASIVTTTAPIITMIIAAMYLKEPITSKKVLGIFVGAIGALILIFGSVKGHGGDGNIWGDVICFAGQVSTAIYLTVYKDIINKYGIVTCMKWMFTYSSICLMPFSFREISTLDFASITASTWWGTAFVVFGGTYIAYVLYAAAQKYLRPTVISMYNYIQPVVAAILTVIIGLDTFGITKAAAMVLIFFGVYIVNKSKSKIQFEMEKAKDEK